MAEYIDKEAVLLEINRQIRRQFLCIASVETIIKKENRWQLKYAR